MNTVHKGGLYPIIKRIRRPLLPVDPPAETTPMANSDDVAPKPAETDASSTVGDEKATDASDSNK